ncbi:hypothetical protein QN277_026504 [Acacia crassicarpa]|uniref:Uncharacterized protein n=1 Tax=Acacia crassicarpa TaxID=499986 RepID=A0AAE1J7S2_9FABA|nr:hypothetical protein QN277_026504 [Acacia crassicarpa]
MGLGPNPVPQSLVSMSSYASKVGVEHCSTASLSNMDMHEKMTPQVYKGHINSKTVKDVTFLGLKCEYVTSGSDCGQIFIRRKKDGKLTHVMKSDKHGRLHRISSSCKGSCEQWISRYGPQWPLTKLLIEQVKDISAYSLNPRCHLFL